jgi:hypothetical protein
LPTGSQYGGLAEGVAMTTEPAASRLRDDSILGIGAGVAAGVAAIYVCNLLGFDDKETGLVLPLVSAVPPALQLRTKSRRRNKNVEIARIQRGELRRPVGLVVMLLAAAIVLLVEGCSTMQGGILRLLNYLVEAHKIEINTAKVVGIPLVGILPIILGMCLFLVASYASHYFAKRPYLWTATAVGCALAIEELLALGLMSASIFKKAFNEIAGSPAGAMVQIAGEYLLILFICMVGAWIGTRYHDAFLARKLARLERKAAKRAAKQDQSAPQSQTTAPQTSAQDSSAPQDFVPFAMNVATQPNGPPASPHDLRTREPLKQIEKLLQLRDMGALTEEEFQAKKTEMLGRI